MYVRVYVKEAYLPNLYTYSSQLLKILFSDGQVYLSRYSLIFERGHTENLNLIDAAVPINTQIGTKIRFF